MFLRQAPKPTFGLRTKLWVDRARPGPGTYNLRRDGNESPKYTMGKHLTRQGTKGPGPGTYHPTLKQTNIRAPMYTMQGRTDYNRETGTPGPGAYDAVEHGRKEPISVGGKFKPQLGMTPGPKGRDRSYRPSGSHGGRKGQQRQMQTRGSSCIGGTRSLLRSAALRGPLFRMSRRFFSRGVADKASGKSSAAASTSLPQTLRPRGHGLATANSRGVLLDAMHDDTQTQKQIIYHLH